VRLAAAGRAASQIISLDALRASRGELDALQASGGELDALRASGRELALYGVLTWPRR
jgi:hypothetical protein